MIASILLLTACSISKQVFVSDLQASKALNFSLEQIDKPYVWGKRGPDEFDCSGLITWAYKQSIGRSRIFLVGKHISDDATMQELYKWNVELVTPEKVKPGDIVFITNDEKTMAHGGLFIRWIRPNEEFQFINASSYFGKVTVDEWLIGETKRT